MVKSRTMAGFDAPYVVGYDCHGLPIELKVDRELGPKKREMSVAEFCQACRAYAERFIGTMTAQFQRLGILGTWDRPVSDDGLRLSGGHRARVRALRRPRTRLQGQEARALVHSLPHGTGRSRSRIPRPHLAVDLRRVPAERRRQPGDRAARAGARRQARLRARSGRRRRGRFRRTWRSRFTRSSTTARTRWTAARSSWPRGWRDKVAAAVGREFGAPVARMKGADLEGIRFRHPLYPRDRWPCWATTSRSTLARAPCTRRRATARTTSGPGRNTASTSTRRSDRRVTFSIMSICSPACASSTPTRRSRALLHERARLWHRESLSHQYPHCWRCHNPVIFLATSQWFIRMDGALRRRHGHAARSGARRHRSPSRRGFLSGATTGSATWWPTGRTGACRASARGACRFPRSTARRAARPSSRPTIVEQAARVFEQHGADAWYSRPAEEFIPAGLACPSCKGTSFERELNILDVWFDSGSSHEAVLSVRPELTWPADMYLEGSDQHRGWFQSSLLVGLGTRGHAPYREVLTHGFLIDLEGRKMSKSVGNSIAPQDVIKESGADILRLWVAMSDYSDEIRISKEILARVVEAYRKIRNTFRYLLSNLFDFDPAIDALPVADLQPVDRFMLARFATGGRGRPALLRRVRLPGDFHGDQRVRDRRPERVLPRRLQGSAVHVPRRLEGAPVGANRPVSDCRRADPAASRRSSASRPTRSGGNCPGTREASVHLAEFPHGDRELARRDRSRPDGSSCSRSAPW